MMPRFACVARRRLVAHAVCVGLGATLAGCMVGPDYKRPEVELPAGYPEVLPGGAAVAGPAVVAVDWWTLFADPVLNDLVQRALAANEDIRQAIARIEETNATLRAVNAAFLPEIDVSGGAARAAIPRAQAISGQTVNNAWRLGLSSTFELDFWGKLRRGAESARATTTASHYAADVVRLTTIGVTAQTYFALRSLDAQIATTEATLGSRGEALRLIQRRAQAGLVSDLDVNQAELARADASAQLKELVRQRAVAQHALGVLTGNLDLAIPAADLMRMPVPAVPPHGLPSTLLERRPDVRQAEQELVAANARIGVARADMFPTISLTAGFGTLSTALSQFVTNDNRTWSVGGSLLGPIFDAGRRRALTEAEQARTQQQVANYRRVIERSFREVADALVTVRQDAAAEADQDARVRAATNALRLANLRYEAGYSAFLEVLDAQRNANDAQLALVRNRQALLSGQVDLMRALGGGWSAEHGLPAPPTRASAEAAADAAVPVPAALAPPPAETGAVGPEAVRAR